jgi:hypothetical protein
MHRRPPTSAQEQPRALGLFPVWSWIPSWYIMAISRNSLVSRLHLHFTFSFFSFAVTGTTIYQTVGSKWKQALQESSLIKYTFGPSKRHCSGQAVSTTTYWVCICTRSCPACKSHAPCYISICALSGSMAFFHSLINRMIFEKKKKYWT